MSDKHPRIGAYVLPGDLAWLGKSLSRYYDLIDDLVVPVPADGKGWTGVPIPVAAALETIASVDSRGLARYVSGTWTDPDGPMRAETAQRQAALDALRGSVDWVLQLDNDEYVPNPNSLVAALRHADELGLDAVEWPMRVLFRQTPHHMFEVVGPKGQMRYDYPGPVAVRPSVRLAHARRTDGEYLRPVAAEDRVSLQITRAEEPGEHRWDGISASDAILHLSWARSTREIRQKMRSWGHSSGLRGTAYYFFTWLPVPLTWRVLRDFHPFASGLWPRLRRRPIAPEERD